MSYRICYSSVTAPKVGFISNAIVPFNEQGKKEIEQAWNSLFDEFKKNGIIHQKSIFHPKRISNPFTAEAAAKNFASEQVDVVIILNSAFPNGQVFLTFATNPYLSRIPMVLTADKEPELGIPEWTTNAWCGVIMNNYVAKRINRYIRALPGNPKEEKFVDELKMLLNVYHTISCMRKEFLARIGDAPSGFHSATGDQLLYASKFGIKVETVDLTAVTNTYKTGIATGYKGSVKFSETDIEKTFNEIYKGRVILVDNKCLKKGIRLYYTIKSIIESNGYTSLAYRCWPEMNEKYIDITPCFAIGYLLGNKIVHSAGCESDWPTAVAGMLGFHLTGKPAACLDFVNYTGGSEIVQLGHCGVGITGYMAPNNTVLMKEIKENNGKISQNLKNKILSGEIKVNDAIAEHTALRQAGIKIGPVHIGQFQYGLKTGIDLICTEEDKLKMLVFVGENTEDTAKGILYSAADIKVKEYRRLHELIMEHGFSHHLAVAFGDISKELKEICKYYGIEYITP